jgi:hypothetical protein
MNGITRVALPWLIGDFSMRKEHGQGNRFNPCIALKWKDRFDGFAKEEPVMQEI